MFFMYLTKYSIQVMYLINHNFTILHSYNYLFIRILKNM